jgi:serine/threonine protein kinase
MAPEQIEGKPADARSDLYAVGVILYEIFCGRRPFEADSAMGVLRQHLEARPPAPRTIDPSLPAALDEILRRALRKRPSKRFASAREFARALDGVSDETGVEGV